MLDNEATIPARLAVAKARGWRLPIDTGRLAATLRRGLRAVREWGGGPIRPFAALWEASLWTTRPDADDGCYSPDPFATEHPFLRDDWP